MNVWVDSKAVVLTSVSDNGLAHLNFLDQDWYLVRRDAGSQDPDGETCWHPADDQLAGTAVYGVNDANPNGPSTFSLPFADFEWTQILLASGDMTMYVVMDRTELQQCTSGQVDGQWHPTIFQSS
eukprot:SAG31_NODE_14086_length_828_cov_0.957476_2_plen_124_part_01